MTYEGAYDIIYSVQDAYDPYAWLFFLAALMLGPIFAFPLFLVVISNTYNSITLAKQLHDAQLARMSGAFSGMLHVIVHRIDGFKDMCGLMDRIDPYVSLELGKEKLTTSVKDNVRTHRVSSFTSFISLLLQF
jgi:hypothetical protein